MAYKTPADLDGFLPLLAKPDTKLRVNLGSDLLKYLAEPSNPTACQNIGELVDGMVIWMQGSNYRIASNGIEALIFLVDRIGSNFRPYLLILPSVIDRLGDAHDTVREKAQLLILKLLEREAATPQQILERLTPGLSHKNAKIREEVLRCIVNIVNEYGAQSVALKGFVPEIVKLLSDPTSAVRETTLSTLVELYKHVGDKLAITIHKGNLVPPQKLAILQARFEETKRAGELLPTATTFSDEVDQSPASSKVSPLPTRRAEQKLKKATSYPSGQGRVFDDNEGAVGGVLPPALPKKKMVGSSSAMKKPTISRSTSCVGAGGVDEDIFLKQFEDVPTLQIYSAKEVTELLKTIQDTISDVNRDWNKRTDALKKLRSLIIAGAHNFDNFHAQLRNLEIPLQNSIKDLRSQVVREACITIAYLSQVLGTKFDHTAEALLNTLINLIQNSAKIIATAGLTCVRFIVKYTPGSRLIPIITTNLQNSKSKEIRRSCCELLEYILSAWSTHLLERHIAILQDSLKRGIADADSEARGVSRKAFRGFKEHFPEQAEALLQSLEPTYRKVLQGEQCVSSSSSSGSLAQTGAVRKQLSAQSAAAKNKRRSNSAIDLHALQRAKARGQYSAMNRMQVSPNTASLPRPKTKKPQDIFVASSTPERTGRTPRRNNSGVSQSQPTSRAPSPNSRLPVMTRRPRRLSAGKLRSATGSRDTSREPSPTRGLGRFHGNERPPISPATRPPVMAQRILQQSREAESALANALACDQADGDYHRIGSPRKSIMDIHSDDSETSSICSERSFDSYRRPSDDIIEIITLCASTVWQERKNGLVSLRLYLSAGNVLSPGELKLITEICTKMFVDSHTKGLSIVLDTVNEIIRRHKNDLDDWLYVLLQKIFYRSGTDLLVSAQNKLTQTLDIVKRSFPPQLQFHCIFKFLVDVAQTPKAKVKVEVLLYLADLCQVAEPGQFVVEPPAQKALQKIIAYSQDNNSRDIRLAAKKCIIALWNFNTPQVTMMLAELPKEQQDVASHIVQSHLRAGSEAESSSSATPSDGSGNDLNREEIFNRLKRTTAEIQNYSFETLGNNSMNEAILIDEDVSYMEQFIGVEGNGRVCDDTAKEDLVEKILSPCPVTLGEHCDLLKKLADEIQQGNVDAVEKNFRKLLRFMIENLVVGRGKLRVAILQVLTEVFKKKQLEPCYSDFRELLTMKVLHCYHDLENREVIKAAETTTMAMSGFPFENIVNILSPMIQTTQYPDLDGVIKMFTRHVELHSTEVTDEHLRLVMPGLIKANDHEISSTRKCAVFCMVALHKAVGEERLAPHVASLSGSKLKLLHLYIKKAQKPSPNSTLKCNNSDRPC